MSQVCFHSRHALCLQQNHSQDNALSDQRLRSDALRPHRWTPLVQPCTFCGNFAARWLCPPCKRPYCADCYSQLHGRGASLAHACNRLGYYTAEDQLRDEHFFRASARRSIERHKKELARNSEPILRKQAALAIQRSYRAARDVPWVAAGFDRQGQSNLTSNGKLTIRKACASVGSLGLLVIHYCHMMLRSRLQWKGHYSGSASQRNIVTILIIHKMQFRRARARYFILQNCTDAP